MTSDRMMQAIGRIERAISRLETAVDKVRETAATHARERDDARARATEAASELETLKSLPRQAAFLPLSDPDAMDPFSHDKALAALRSLDSLIDDLQRARRDG